MVWPPSETLGKAAPKHLCVPAARNTKKRSAKTPFKASLYDRASEGAATQTSICKAAEIAVLRTAFRLALEGEKRITSAVYGFVRSEIQALQHTVDRMFAGHKARSKKVLTVSCRPDHLQDKARRRFRRCDFSLGSLAFDSCVPWFKRGQGHIGLTE